MITENRTASRSATTAAFPHGSSLDRYLAEISHHPILTREQEGELASEARAGRRQALNRLVECNLRFVVKIASEYHYLGLPAEDLISEGNLGLIEAARRYDPARGTKFVSWAVFWIRKAIREFIYDHLHSVRLPASQVKRIQLFRVIEEELTNEFGRPPTRGELKKRLPKHLKQIDPIHRYGIRCTALDEPTSDEQPVTLGDVLEDSSQDTAEERLLNQEAAQHFKSLFEQLDEKQQSVVTWRFGLDGEKRLTLDAAAKRLGCSREWVRIVEGRALRRLRQLFAMSEWRTAQAAAEVRAVQVSLRSTLNVEHSNDFDHAA